MTADNSPLAPPRRFGASIASLCSIEMFERLAYFAVRTVIPVYIMQADDPGGLHLTAADKGTIYAWWFFFQSVLPIVTGGFADRYGTKRVLAASLSLMTAGYVLMAYMTGYWPFFFAVMTLAAGTAFFKPSLKAAFARNLDEGSSSVGWGLFYWIANVGALIAPFIATAILGDAHTHGAWRMLFLTSAGFTLVNLLIALVIRTPAATPGGGDGPIAVLRRTVIHFFEPRLLAYLLIVSLFYVMMIQLWDLQPNFILDWVDSGSIAASLRFLPDSLFDLVTRTTSEGVQIPQQILLNLNPALVILLMIPIAWVVRRMRTLTALLVGMLFAIAGILVAGLTQSAGLLLAGIFLFSLGEMLTGPKKIEYLGLIAPPEKKGLYLGYVSLPAGLGGILGSKLSGYIYGQYGEKATLALRYLVEHTTAGAGCSWNGDVASLPTALGIPRTEAFTHLQSRLGIDAHAATQLLWDTYHPQIAVWLPLAGMGLIAAIAMAVFGRMARKWADMNA